jgi:hypothetical protein
MLFVQGSRDAFGTPDELRPIIKKLKAPADLYVALAGVSRKVAWFCYAPLADTPPLTRPLVLLKTDHVACCGYE